MTSTVGYFLFDPEIFRGQVNFLVWQFDRNSSKFTFFHYVFALDESEKMPQLEGRGEYSFTLLFAVTKYS